MVSQGPFSEDYPLQVCELPPPRVFLLSSSALRQQVDISCMVFIVTTETNSEICGM